MAKKWKRKSKKFITPPKFVTADENGSCVIYELKVVEELMNNTECLYSSKQKVRYDGANSLVEDHFSSMILNLRAGTSLPEKYGDVELCWYEDDMCLEDIITMCVI